MPSPDMNRGEPTSPAPVRRYSIDSIIHAVRLLNELTSGTTLTLAEASRIVGASRSTAYRVLVTLEGEDLVERLPEGGYRAGRRLIAWATRLLSQMDVRTMAGPGLRQLRDETGETVNLAVLRSSGLVYTDILESAAAFRMADRPGSVVPIHATALGKAVGAYLDPARLAALVGPEPYESLTPRTCVRWSALSAQMAESRTRGFATDIEERALGVVCAAAPILVDATPVAGISVSGPRVRIPDERLADIGERVARLANDVAKRLAPNGGVADLAPLQRTRSAERQPPGKRRRKATP